MTTRIWSHLLVVSADLFTALSGRFNSEISFLHLNPANQLLNVLPASNPFFLLWQAELDQPYLDRLCIKPTFKANHG